MSAAIDRLPDPILVVGAYGYRNVGDEAILAGLLAKIGSRPVTVVSRDPDATRRLHGVPSVGIGGAVSAMVRHRSVIIGGGGLFGPDMGRIGRLLPAFGLGALALRRPVLVEGVDVDAQLGPAARFLVPALLRRAVKVTVRDRRSAAILRGWGVRADLAPDLSLWMPMRPAADGRALLRSAGIDTRRPIVGLALTGLRPALADAVLDAVTAAIDALPDVQFCVLPMSRHPRVPAHDDLVLARRLRALRPRVAIVEDEAHPATVLAAVGQLSAVITMRYHAMLFADRVRVPLVPIVYAEKAARWLEEHGRLPVAAAPGAVITALREALLGEERTAPPVRVRPPSDGATRPVRVAAAAEGAA